MHQTLQATPHACGVEVYEQPNGVSGDLQVSDYLRELNRVNALDGFHFDNDLTLHKEIDFEFAPESVDSGM